MQKSKFPRPLAMRLVVGASPRTLQFIDIAQGCQLLLLFYAHFDLLLMHLINYNVQSRIQFRACVCEMRLTTIKIKMKLAKERNESKRENRR